MEQEQEEKPLTRAEVGDAFTALGQTLTALNTQVQELAGVVKELKQHKAAEDEETLTDLFHRAIGHDQARIDGRTSLAKQHPKETKPEGDTPQIISTGNPLVDGMVSAIVGGQFAQELQQGREV